jgi:hypothetical protein
MKQINQEFQRRVQVHLKESIEECDYSSYRNP